MCQLENEEMKMTGKMKRNGLPRIVFAAAILVSLSAGAAFAYQSDGYSFDAAGQASGDTVTVQVVNMATGQPVADAHLFGVHMEYRGAKATPSVVYHFIPMTSDGHGGYAYENRDVEAGTILTVVAQMAGHDSYVWGKVRVPD
jgi:hypothetical protein